MILIHKVKNRGPGTACGWPGGTVTSAYSPIVCKAREERVGQGEEGSGTVRYGGVIVPKGTEVIDLRNFNLVIAESIAGRNYRINPFKSRVGCTYSRACSRQDGHRYAGLGWTGGL